MRTRKFFVSLGFAVILSLSLGSQSAYAEEVKFMGFDELDARLKNGSVPAYFETVSTGTTMQRYSILVHETYNSPGTKIIMFTTWYEIVAGMSGSPVYVPSLDGKTRKLLGALAYSFGSHPVREKWGGISPIVLMHQEADTFYTVLDEALKASDGPHSQSILPRNFAYRNMMFSPISLGIQPIRDMEKSNTVLSVGMSEALRDTSLVAMAQSPSASPDQPTVLMKTPAKLVAGMPILVELLEWEDANKSVSTLGAVGTITYVGPNGEVYAFGHPFLEAKFVVYRFRTCKIIGSVLSREKSFKLGGIFSEPLGMIGFDGNYGIYGVKKERANTSLNLIGLQYNWQDSRPARYTVRMARVPAAPGIINMALNVIGSIVGVPQAQQASMTELTTRVSFGDDRPNLEVSDIAMPVKMQVGPTMVYQSSYEAACEHFLTKIYMPLTNNSFGVRVRSYVLTFQFTGGVSKVLHIASTRFPSKVVFGTTPELEVVLVSEDNSVAFSRKIKIPIDWTRVENPIYNAATKETDKQPEKTIRGVVVAYTSDFVRQYLTPTEKELNNTEYFLNGGEFMQAFTRELQQNNTQLFVRAILRKRSGDAPAKATDTPSVIPEGGIVHDGWTVHDKLTERRVSVKDSSQVAFTVNLEAVPGGYMFAPIDQVFSYEVILADPAK